MLLGSVGLLLTGCGRDVEVFRSEVSAVPAPIRIVSLAPSITEAVCAVGAGALLVGRTSACDYPDEVVASVPVIGGFGTPSLELLAEVRPTLVLETALADEAVGLRIDTMGLRRERIRCRGLEDIPGMLRQVGALTGRETTGRELAAELSRKLFELRATASERVRPKVYAEIWHDPMTTIGAGTFLSDLIALAGGESVGDDAGKDYYQVSPERVLSSAPDVILCLYMGQNEGAADAVKARPGWQHLKAVRNGAVFDGLANDILLRPGPRVLEGVALLQACFRTDKTDREDSP
jgi:iron complex transport system substrate-binding protein